MLRTTVLACAAAHVAVAFAPALSAAPRWATARRMSEEPAAAAAAPAPAAAATDPAPFGDGLEPRAAETALLRLAAATNRGASATPAQQREMDSLCQLLKACADDGPASVTAECDVDRDVPPLDGRWRLVYATEPAYRSSPFFAAWRKLLADVDSPLALVDAKMAEAIFGVTDGLSPFYAVDSAVQTVSGSETLDGTLVSEVELVIKLPFWNALPRFSSLMTSTARIAPVVGADASRLAVTVEKTEVKDSSIQSLIPALLSFDINAIAFPTEDVFEQLKAGSATVQAATSFLARDLRMTRYEAGDEGRAEKEYFLWSREP